SFITEFDGVIARFSSKSGLIPTLGMDNQNESVAARIKQRFETYRDQWKALIVYGLEQWKSSIRDKMIGDEFNDELYRRIDELYIRGIEQVFSLKGAFGEDLAEIFRQVAENSDSFRNLLSESQEILARHECDPLDTHYPPWVPEATVRYLNISVARPAKVKGGRHGRVFFKVKVEVDTCHGKIDEATTKLQAAADEYANSLGKEIPKDFRQYRDAQLAVFFIEQLRSRKEKKQKQAEEIKTELETLQKQIAPLRSALDRLHRFADDFRMKC
ncbi:MAG: hypothetical protein WCK17_17130, partial [Verrucomicrobiota bacterium]